MTTVVTKQYTPSGRAFEAAYDDKDRLLPDSVKSDDLDPARAYQPHSKPERTIFERTDFKWIPGVA